MDTERHRLFTVEDVASLTGVSPSTIRNYTRSGAVRPRRGWNSEAGRCPTRNRRCWIYTKKEIDEIVKNVDAKNLNILDNLWVIINMLG